MHGIDFLYANASSAMDAELLADSFIASKTIVCSCCGRIADRWFRPEAVASKHYGMNTVHCIPCHALFHGSVTHLGIERTANATGGPVDVPGKLGMLSSCAMLVSQSETTIFTGEGYFAKLGKATNPFYKLTRKTGFQQILKLLEINPEPPFLFISDIGRKKNELVTNLAVTTRSDQWHLCSATGISTINPVVIKRLLTAISGSALNLKIVGQWFKALKRVTAGYILANDRSVLMLTELMPEFRKDILPLFPHDPYQRMDTLRIVQALLESAYGGA